MRDHGPSQSSRVMRGRRPTPLVGLAAVVLLTLATAASKGSCAEAAGLQLIILPPAPLMKTTADVKHVDDIPILIGHDLAAVPARAAASSKASANAKRGGRHCSRRVVVPGPRLLTDDADESRRGARRPDHGALQQLQNISVLRRDAAVSPLLEQIQSLDREGMQRMVASTTSLIKDMHAERDRDTAHAWQKHRSDRSTRRLQDIEGAWSTPSPLCEDFLATNDGLGAPCTYSCDSLKTHYFPGEEHTVTCFLHDQVSGWPTALLDRVKARQDAHVFVDTTADASTLPFTIGAGPRACTNITVVTSPMTGPAHTISACVVDGEHEHNHTVTDPHTVEVVGYATSEMQYGAGNATTFVVGECVDVLIRITTTVSSHPVTWQLETESGQTGPWVFDSPAGAGVHEHPSCMFDNHYTLTRVGAGGDWSGTAAVVGYISYHNTIEIPTSRDTRWIVQGQLREDGLPVEMPGRLSSGSSTDWSQASIVARHVRFSGNMAPIEVAVSSMGPFSQGKYTECNAVCCSC